MATDTVDCCDGTDGGRGSGREEEEEASWFEVDRREEGTVICRDSVGVEKPKYDVITLYLSDCCAAIFFGVYGAVCDGSTFCVDERIGAIQIIK